MNRHCIMTMKVCSWGRLSVSSCYTANNNVSAAVKKLLELKAEISSIPLAELNIERGEGGQMWYKLDFDIEMTCMSGSLHFTIVYDGKKYDTVRQEFV